jgi:hypothetical protein
MSLKTLSEWMVKHGIERSHIVPIISLGLGEAVVYYLGTNLMINKLGPPAYALITWVSGKPLSMLTQSLAHKIVASRFVNADNFYASTFISIEVAAIKDILFTTIQVSFALLVYAALTVWKMAIPL